jgi:sugar transferase (PEP-CTERM/EpsH1 system associated)
MGDILFLSHRVPYPPDRGDKIRGFHILKHLASRSRVHIAAFADDPRDLRAKSGLRPFTASRTVLPRGTSKLRAMSQALLQGRPASVTAFDDAAMRAAVADVLARESIEAIYVFSSQMAQYLPEKTDARVIMDFVDVDSAKFEAYADEGGAMAPVYRREAARLARFERDTAARADVSLFVSDAEAALFRSRCGLTGADIRSLQNGVDLDFFHPGAPFERVEMPRPLLLFTGQMDYPPNVDAVRWFAEAVLPRLPDARFAIVGRNPAESVRRLAGDRVTVTGAVPDVRGWVAAADAVVAPLRIARGIQNKVLEAMAMARPVVASPAAFEGIEAEPGRDLLVAEGAEAQAAAIAGLLADPARGRALGRAGRRRMEEAYSWSARLAPLAGILAPAGGKAAA